MPTKFTSPTNRDAYNATVWEIVRQIPAGKVTTYGQIAALAGYPGQARQVGYALHALRDDDVPWFRVVNAAGKISLDDGHGGASLQRVLLEQEGVEFSPEGRLSLARYQWNPVDSGH